MVFGAIDLYLSYLNIILVFHYNIVDYLNDAQRQVLVGVD
jgi:hypothetical protein